MSNLVRLKIYRGFVRGLLALALFSFCSAAAANWSGHLNLATDYMFRGIKQTQNGPALSASLRYDTSAGFYAGAWAGRVDFGSQDNGRLEFDYFIGYQKPWSKNLHMETALVRYSYPGRSGPMDYDWQQWFIKLYVHDRWTLSAGIDNNWGGADKNSEFLDLGYSRPLPFQLSLHLNASYHKVEDIFGENYAHFEAALSRPIAKAHLSLTLSTTDNNGKHLFYRRADTRLVGAISWSFD